jgi:hypothetical protein
LEGSAQQPLITQLQTSQNKQIAVATQNILAHEFQADPVFQQNVDNALKAAAPNDYNWADEYFKSRPPENYDWGAFFDPSNNVFMDMARELQRKYGLSPKETAFRGTHRCPDGRETEVRYYRTIGGFRQEVPTTSFFRRESL